MLLRLNKLGFLNDSDSSAPGDRVSMRTPPRRSYQRLPAGVLCAAEDELLLARVSRAK